MKLNELFNIAQKELKDLSNLSNPDFRLEQAELISNENVWEIVVSFLVENTNKKISPFGSLTAEYQFHRMYKKVKINNDNGEIIGFYIYDNK